MENVLTAWSHIANSVFKNDNTYQTALLNWNMDTGKNVEGDYVYWKGPA
ncbi:MAG: hypothetical protein ABI284_04935 [Nitrosospira sp.]